MSFRERRLHAISGTAFDEASTSGDELAAGDRQGGEEARGLAGQDVVQGGMTGVLEIGAFSDSHLSSLDV